MVALPLRFVNAFLDLLERGRGSCYQDNVGAALGESFGGRRADAAAGAGDERELAREWLRISHARSL